MTKNIIHTLIIFLLIGSLSSCNTYHGLSSATKISHLRANPFLQKVSRSVLTNISQDVIAKGITSFKGEPKLLSPLAALFNTPESVVTFKKMLRNTYGLSQTAIEDNYAKWTTVRDVIGYVAWNAKYFDFNSYSNKLY